MDIEKEIFKKSIIDYDKLISYGFVKEKDKYIFSKNILNNSFKVFIEVKNKTIKGKVFDLTTNYEYTNYRITNEKGKFSYEVRKEFESILVDIKNKCTTNSFFTSFQANRITDLIIKKYGSYPEFMWDKYKGYAVFRNKDNHKWYGIIMNIDKSKITKGSGEVEILNVKLAKSKIKDLLSKKGFYKAYHMNKENWITILLDDTISDSLIMDLVSDSYECIREDV